MKISFVLAALLTAAAVTGCNRQDADSPANAPPTSAGTASAPMTGASR